MQITPYNILVMTALVSFVLVLVSVLVMMAQLSVADHENKPRFSMLKIDASVTAFVLIFASVLYIVTLQNGRKSFNEGKELMCHPEDKPIIVSKARGYVKRDDYLIKENEIISLSSCEVLTEEK
ncbi:MAG: hypothetical protein PHH41_02445 [Sulfurimonas sp.]|nr:hypothetical protein [Sulfurimonas sp.]MDD3060801.1 hypothetical protein [Sulfurimonas sp.]MDD5201981.1 hypothetical protein [Sulfurimonas sp.]